MTAAQTLMIHCFGVFARSWSSGWEGLDVWDVREELENLDTQSHVLGDVEVLDLVVLQVPLLLVQDVFEEVDRCVIWKKMKVS